MSAGISSKCLSTAIYPSIMHSYDYYQNPKEKLVGFYEETRVSGQDDYFISDVRLYYSLITFTIRQYENAKSKKEIKSYSFKVLLKEEFFGKEGIAYLSDEYSGPYYPLPIFELHSPSPVMVTQIKIRSITNKAIEVIFDDKDKTVAETEVHIQNEINDFIKSKIEKTN